MAWATHAIRGPGADGTDHTVTIDDAVGVTDGRVVDTGEDRIAAEWPFAVDSVWNLPLSTDATFENVGGSMTSDLRDTAHTVWVNHGNYGHGITYAENSDPLCTITDTNDASRSASNVRIPTDVYVAPGGDKHAHIITPDGRYGHENWLFQGTSPNYTTGRHHQVDYQGSGIGPQNGTRAYGGSAIGGLIRHWEIIEGVIRHPIAMALTNGQLLYTSGSSGYDGSGYGTALGYTWPATEQDWGSESVYTGNIPMGAYVALDPSFDVEASSLSNSGKILARAFRDYGGYVTDRSGSFSMAYVENITPWTDSATETAVDTFVNELLNEPSWNAADLGIIRANLRVVTNNSASTPNGGTYTGDDSNRRAALAPGIA